MKKDRRKDRINIVYSTDPGFEYTFRDEESTETLPPSQQTLCVGFERKGRKGKSVTLVSGFTGKREDLENLGRSIRSFCATGGSVKEGEIIIQGDFRKKIAGFLSREGYRVKQTGG